MTIEDLKSILSLLLAGGIGGTIVALAQAWKIRQDGRREDRKAKVDETTTFAESAKTIAESAGSMVELHDDMAAELKSEIAALRDEVKQERENTRCERENNQRERDEFQKRLTDAESRIARAERRAAESDSQANEFRKDVIRLGERLTRERKEHQSKINKLVIIIEKLFEQLKEATGKEPDVDLEALKQMVVIDKAG